MSGSRVNLGARGQVVRRKREYRSIARMNFWYVKHISFDSPCGIVDGLEEGMRGSRTLVCKNRCPACCSSELPGRRQSGLLQNLRRENALKTGWTVLLVDPDVGFDIDAAGRCLIDGDVAQCCMAVNEAY